MPYATENMLNSCSTEAKLSHSTNALWKRNSPKTGFQIIFNTNTVPLTACIWVSRMHNSVKLKASSSEQHLCSYVNFKVLPKGAHSKAPCFKTFRHFKATFANSKPGSLFSKPLAFRNLALSGLTALLWLVMLLTAEDIVLLGLWSPARYTGRPWIVFHPKWHQYAHCLLSWANSEKLWNLRRNLEGSSSSFRCPSARSKSHKADLARNPLVS